MNEDDYFLQRVAAEFQKYPEFPSEVRDWILKAIAADVHSQFLGRLQESPHEMISGLNAFFEVMRQILNCDNKTLAWGTDFDSDDLDPERFDAMIAELRGVGFLHDEGFSGIRLLSGSRERRGADIVAANCGTWYAVEVACSSRNAYRYPDHKRRSSDLKQWIVDTFYEKQEQLTQTAERESCCMRALVAVMNSYPALPLLTPPEYLSVLKEVWNQLGKLEDVRLAVVTGMIVLGYGRGDCVFPPWS